MPVADACCVCQASKLVDKLTLHAKPSCCSRAPSTQVAAQLHVLIVLNTRLSRQRAAVWALSLTEQR